MLYGPSQHYHPLAKLPSHLPVDFSYGIVSLHTQKREYTCLHFFNYILYGNHYSYFTIPILEITLHIVSA